MRSLLVGTCFLCCVLQSDVSQAANSNVSPKEAKKAHFNPCVITGQLGSNREEAECVTLRRPLDPDNADGPNIQLRVARINSLAPTPAADAFTVINGGPGGSSSVLYANLAPAFAAILRERDIIIVDQRGTGHSARLSCPDSDTPQNDLDAEAIAKLASECLETLPADPRFFTTSIAVRDLEEIRKQLGYSKLSIYAVSYGTRVAQHYARQYPQRTRALVLDGAIPTTMALGPEIAINAQKTIESMLDRCAANTHCRDAFPSLKTDLQTLQARLRAQPQTVTLAHPVTGTTTEMDIEYGHLSLLLRFLSYVPETASILPVLIHEAANHENYLPLASQAIKITSELGTLADGMHNAIVCTEDVPFYDNNKAQLTSQLANTFLGSEQVEALIAICDQWPAGRIDENFKKPFESSIPTLLLSGEFDPITPPANAEEILPYLSRAIHLIAKGQGHGVIIRGCMPVLLRDFVANPDPFALETSCINRMGPSPFFVDLMGPAR